MVLHYVFVYTHKIHISIQRQWGKRAPFLPVDGARDHKRSLARARKWGSYHLNQNCGYLKHISLSTQYIVFIVIEWQALLESLFGTSMSSTNANFMVIESLIVFHLGLLSGIGCMSTSPSPMAVNTSLHYGSNHIRCPNIFWVLLLHIKPLSFCNFLKIRQSAWGELPMLWDFWPS